MRCLLALLILFFLFSSCHEKEANILSKLEEKMYPYYDRYLEFNFPNDKVDIKAYVEGLEEANAFRLNAVNRSPGFDQEWTVQGPGNIGARVNTLAINPNNHNEIYAGFSGGGLFKTLDGGNTWDPIFDQNSFLAIGHVCIDPMDDQTIYVGTGDPNLGGFPNIGNGVFKSIDGGLNWTYIGLEEQRIISKVEVNPNNNQEIFVASMGLPFTKNNTRGIYRSQNGGSSWEQVLSVSDSTGFTDVIINPEMPNIVYATSWDRVRSNAINLVNGEGSNLYRSTDGGDTWETVLDGLPDGRLGRHGIDICKSAPNNVYVVVVDVTHNLEGIYRSQDYGASFESIPIDNLDPGVFGGFGWYFGKLHVNTVDPEHVFILGVDLFETRDAGDTWLESAPPWWTYIVHADKHDLQILNNGQMFLATDGGVYKKQIDDEDWTDIENIPATQFYRTAYNPHNPELYYGGAQDNGTTSGNANAIDEWVRNHGGDGFQMVFHPTDPELYFVETQLGGITQYLNGEANDATEGLEGPRDWDMQYIMSPHDPNVMYTGTDKVYASYNSYLPFWTAISEDLTDAGVVANRPANITCLDESIVEQGVLYVGTNNGNVQVKRPVGDWEKVSGTLPERYVTDIKASPYYEGWAYVSFSGYKDNDFSPRLYRTQDYGQSWEPIIGNLPNIAINDLFIIPDVEDQLLFVATDAGVYGTQDAGETWERLGVNMPNVVTYDLAYNVEKKELVAATFARSMQSYNIESLLAEPSSTQNEEQIELMLYPNPVSTVLNISGVGDANVQVIDQMGREVLKGNLQNGQINLSTVNNGIYWVTIRNDEIRTTKKIVIAKE